MKIYSVIVTYNPNLIILRKFCVYLISNNIKILLIDNSENKNNDFIFQNDSDVSIISLGKNMGIAYAQNIGIREALKRSADIILFFDQDSKLDDDFLINILNPIKESTPIIIAPIFFDERTRKELPSIKINDSGIGKKIFGNNKESLYKADVVISSGTAITREVFNILGFMDESFFIDFVDIDWSLRCKENNIPIFINPKAKMIHTIGTRTVKLWLVNTTIHSPYRTYYKLRNSFLILRKHDLSIFLIKQIITVLLHCFIQLFLIEDKGLYIRYLFLAIFHGIIGKSGKQEEL